MQTERKPGIFLWFGYRIPVADRIRLIREAGFKTVLHWWDDSFLQTEGLTKEEQAVLIRNAGLAIENAHLQFSRANLLWLDTLDGQAVFEGYLSDIDGLASMEIPAAVIHPTTGVIPPPISDAGMRRMRALADRAERRGVRIAVENVRNTHYLTHILDAIESPMLGLCYDSGHDYIWSPSPYDLLQKYAGRLFAVHLHDNMGVNDDHLEPGRGRVDWDAVLSGIRNSTYEGSYTLESDSADIPESRSPEEHIAIHYSALSALISR